MKCQTCGVPLPAVAKVCPNCGTVVPRPDGTIVDTSAQEPLMPPTIYSDPVPPTIYSDPVPPAANYDPAIQNPYDMRSQSPSAPYNNSQYQPLPYNQAIHNQAIPGQYPNQYAGMPPVYPPPGYLPPQQQPRRKTRWGLIVGIIAGILVLACIGTSIVVGGLYNIGKNALNADATATATARTGTTVSTPVSNTNPVTDTTPTVTNPAPQTNSTGASPSGTPIDANAATIITNVQSAAGVDNTTAAPKNLTSTFKTNDIVYVTFTLNNEKVDLTNQKIYVTAKLYIDSKLVTTFDPITFDKPSPGGYFSATYKVASQGAMEIYLCYKSDCSDEKLAQVINYTIVQA